jgi:hypothetical protein
MSRISISSHPCTLITRFVPRGRHCFETAQIFSVHYRLREEEQTKLRPYSGDCELCPVSLTGSFDSWLSELMCPFVICSCKLMNVKMLKRKCVFSETVNEEYSSSKIRRCGSCYLCALLFEICDLSRGTQRYWRSSSDQETQNSYWSSIFKYKLSFFKQGYVGEN